MPCLRRDSCFKRFEQTLSLKSLLEPSNRPRLIWNLFFLGGRGFVEFRHHVMIKRTKPVMTWCFSSFSVGHYKQLEVWCIALWALWAVLVGDLNHWKPFICIHLLFAFQNRLGLNASFDLYVWKGFQTTNLEVCFVHLHHANDLLAGVITRSLTPLSASSGSLSSSCGAQNEKKLTSAFVLWVFTILPVHIYEACRNEEKHFCLHRQSANPFFCKGFDPGSLSWFPHTRGYKEVLVYGSQKPFEKMKSLRNSLCFAFQFLSPFVFEATKGWFPTYQPLRPETQCLSAFLSYYIWIHMKLMPSIGKHSWLCPIWPGLIMTMSFRSV